MVIKWRRMRWAVHVARMGRMRKGYKILVGKPEGRHRRRWEGNVRMDLREMGWEGANWIHLAQDSDQWEAVVNTVVNR
jgi:hypothetical protein